MEDKCQMCSKVFKSKAQFKEHVDKDHKGHDSIFPCAECFAFFKERRKLERHVIARHNDSFEHSVNCPYKDCNTLLLGKDQLRRHLTEVHRADPNDYIPRPLKLSKVESSDEWNNGCRRVVVPKSEMQLKCVVDWCSYVAKRRNHFIVHMDRVHNMKGKQFEKLSLKFPNDSDDEEENDQDEDKDDCEIIESSSESDNENGA